MWASGTVSRGNFRKPTSTRHSGCSRELASIKWPTSAPTNYPADSGSEFGICRALIQNPDLLLVDEPTASLDPKTSRQIMRLIKELCAERKLSAIINIHDVMLAQMFAERIVGLQLGEIVYDGPPKDLTADVLTKIYGEEDWSATTRKADEDTDEAVEPPNNVITLEPREPLRDRMAGLT